MGRNKWRTKQTQVEAYRFTELLASDPEAPDWVKRWCSVIDQQAFWVGGWLVRRSWPDIKHVISYYPDDYFRWEFEPIADDCDDGY